MKQVLLVCLVLCLVGSSFALNARLTRRTTTKSRIADHEDNSLSNYKEEVYTRGQATASSGTSAAAATSASTEGQAEFEEKRIEDDDAPEGGSSIIVDNHNSIDVEDTQLDHKKFVAALRAQEDEQTNKRASEQSIKKQNAESRDKEDKETNDLVNDMQKKTEEQKQKQKQRAEAAKGVIRGPAWKLTKGEVVRKADQIKFTGKYTYMFWVRPLAAVGGWSNILHKGKENVNRNPAIWFYPGSTRLHIRSGVNDKPTWENGGNAGCDPSENLPLNQWTHVAVTHEDGALKVYYNGGESCAAKLAAPVENDGDLYAADPWHDAANAEVADLRTVGRIVSLDDIKVAANDRKFIS